MAQRRTTPEVLRLAFGLLCVAPAAMACANSGRHIGRIQLATRRIADALQDGLIRPIPQRAFALSDARLERQFAPADSLARSTAMHIASRIARAFTVTLCDSPCSRCTRLCRQRRVPRGSHAHDRAFACVRGSVVPTSEPSLAPQSVRCAAVRSCCWHDPLCCKRPSRASLAMRSSASCHPNAASPHLRRQPRANASRPWQHKRAAQLACRALLATKSERSPVGQRLQPMATAECLRLALQLPVGRLPRSRYKRCGPSPSRSRQSRARLPSRCQSWIMAQTAQLFLQAIIAGHDEMDLCCWAYRPPLSLAEP